MQNELFLNDVKSIDNIELLTRFTASSKGLAEQSDMKSSIITSIDVVTAVYYFRQYQSADDFINKFLKGNSDYMLLQWVRVTWDKLHKMSEEDISDLVIKQFDLITNAEAELES